MINVLLLYTSNEVITQLDFTSTLLIINEFLIENSNQIPYY